MIHLTFTSPEAENVVYISTEENRLDTNAVDSQLRYLFEITNDMGTTLGVPYTFPEEYVREQYTYPIKYTIADRYNSFTLIASSNYTSSNLFNGKVYSLPVGYYYYKVYECSTLSTNSLAFDDTTMPIDAEGRIGFISIRKNSAGGTKVQSTKLLAGVQSDDNKVSDLSSGTYFIRMQSSSGTFIDSGLTALGIPQVQAQSDGSRWLEITNVVKNEVSNGLDITIKSECPVGYSYEFDNGSGAYQHLVEITSKPQTNTLTFARSTDDSPTLRLYDSSNGHSGTGSQVWGASNGREFLIPNAANMNFGTLSYTAWNPEMIDSGGAVLSKGSFYYSGKYGSTVNSVTQEIFVVQGEVAQGKLYIEMGEEDLKEVRYKQYEQTETLDYIYNSSFD